MCSSDLIPGEIYQIAAAALAYGYVGAGSKGADFEFFLHRMDELLATARTDHPSRSTSTIKTQNSLDAAFQRNVFNRPIISLTTLLGLLRVHQSDTRAVAWHRVAGVAMAVERFKLAHEGQLPETLDQLAPKFFESVPVDPFDGQPLRYRKLERG